MREYAIIERLCMVPTSTRCGCEIFTGYEGTLNKIFGKVSNDINLNQRKKGKKVHVGLRYPMTLF